MAGAVVSAILIGDRTGLPDQVRERLQAAGIRAELDDRQEKIGYKIREAQVQKVPYMLVVGDKEQQADAVNIRLRSGEQLGAKPVAEALALIKEAADTRAA